MKKNVLIVCLLWLATMPLQLMAKNPNLEKRDLIWTDHQNPRTGLYSVTNNSVGEGFSITPSLVYYYGDVDMLGVAFKEGFQKQNLSFGGSLNFAYLMPLGNYCNARYSLGAGYLHGNDSSRLGGYQKGKFNSIFVEASVGVEYYPFPTAGFYIYAGLAVNYSYVTYDFSHCNQGKGVMNSIVPMIPVEIGYDFDLGKSWHFTIFAACHPCLIDLPNASLDGWPTHVKSQQTSTDGYFVLGLSASYRWHNCKNCRKYQGF